MSQRRLGIIFPDYLDPSCSGEVPCFMALDGYKEVDSGVSW